MKHIQAITFDLDDTLWAVMPVLRRAEQRLHQWLLAHCPDAARSFDVDAMRALRAQVARENPGLAHDLTLLRKKTLQAALTRHGHSPTDADAALEVFLAARHEVTLYADVTPALRTLSRRFRLASLSNGNADVRRVGLGRYFGIRVNAAEVGAVKPDHAIFRAACERLGCPPRQVLHVGDHPEHDVLGAADAGMKTVWVNRDGARWEHAHRPDAEVPSLAPIAGLLAGNP